MAVKRKIQFYTLQVSGVHCARSMYTLADWQFSCFTCCGGCKRDWFSPQAIRSLPVPGAGCCKSC